MTTTETTYSDSAKGVTITKARAIKEILDHGCEPGEFLAEVGERDTYEAASVLEWLGY